MNFYDFRIFDAFRRSRTTDNLVRMEILDDFIRFHRVVLMAFVHNDDKMQTGIQRVFNMLQEVGVFAVFQSVVALFRQLFPVDETVIIFFKSARHYIGEQFCLSGMDILIHLFLALSLIHIYLMVFSTGTQI